MDDSLELRLALPLEAEEALDVRLARARDPAVWSRWYDQHFPTLYRYALARLGSREEAEDVAAQVFLQALAAIDRYRYRGRPVLAWFYRIAHNLVADRLRSPARRLAQGEGHEPEGGQPDSESLLDGIELQRALDRLKPEQREVVVLRLRMGLSTRETAQLLGKSEAAVHSLQVRAVENLRRLLRHKPLNLISRPLLRPAERRREREGQNGQARPGLYPGPPAT